MNLARRLPSKSTPDPPTAAANAPSAAAAVGPRRAATVCGRPVPQRNVSRSPQLAVMCGKGAAIVSGQEVKGWGGGVEQGDCCREAPTNS